MKTKQEVYGIKVGSTEALAEARKLDKKASELEAKYGLTSSWATEIYALRDEASLLKYGQ